MDKNNFYYPVSVFGANLVVPMQQANTKPPLGGFVLVVHFI